MPQLAARWRSVLAVPGRRGAIPHPCHAGAVLARADGKRRGAAGPVRPGPERVPGHPPQRVGPARFVLRLQVAPGRHRHRLRARDEGSVHRSHRAPQAGRPHRPAARRQHVRVCAHPAGRPEGLRRVRAHRRQGGRQHGRLHQEGRARRLRAAHRQRGQPAAAARDDLSGRHGVRRPEHRRRRRHHRQQAAQPQRHPLARGPAQGRRRRCGRGLQLHQPQLRRQLQRPAAGAGGNVGRVRAAQQCLHRPVQPRSLRTAGRRGGTRRAGQGSTWNHLRPAHQRAVHRAADAVDRPQERGRCLRCAGRPLLHQRRRSRPPHGPQPARHAAQRGAVAAAAARRRRHQHHHRQDSLEWHRDRGRRCTCERCGRERHRRPGTHRMNRIHRSLLCIAIANAMLPRFGAYAAPADGGSLPTIRPLMVLRPVAASSTEYELLVYGDIGDSWWGESVTALSVVQQLQALDAGVTQINVRINSYGGSVSDGIAIYNALKRHSAKKVVTVDGVAMSSASLIAMAGDEIQMPATSLLMIHAPWGMAQGNAQDMRVMADVLDTYASAMAGAYAAKTGKPTADMLALLADGIDHYYTGEQAVAEGFADTLVDATADTGGEAAQQDAAARAAGVGRMLDGAPDNIRTLAIAAAARHPAALPKATQPRLRVPEGMDIQSLQNALASASGQRALVTALTTAASANDGELTMKLRKLFAAMATLRDPARDPADGGHGGGSGAPDTAAVHAALRTRNDEIRAVLEPYKARAGIGALLLDSLTDPTATVDSVRAKALALVGADTTPSGGSRIEMGADETDKIRAAGTDYLLARAGILKGEAAVKARQGNPFNGNTMMDMARSFAARGGVVVAGMSRDQIIASAITHSTSDFSLVLENALHKTIVNAYNQQESTWRQFCSISTLSDFRAHNRYYLSSFSDLKPVKENGEYEDGTINDAEKETITGTRSEE